MLTRREIEVFSFARSCTLSNLYLVNDLNHQSGREETPVHSILYIITIPVEKVKNGYDGNSIQTLERVYKYYYFIIRERTIV